MATETVLRLEYAREYFFRDQTVMHARTLRHKIAPLIPGSVRPAARRAYDFLEYEIGRRTGRRDPLIPPRWLHIVGSGDDSDFVAIGEEFFRLFVDVGGLEPHHRILDVGCGTGRMARPLTRYLANGSYEGMDIVGTSIQWCQRTYSRRFSNFHFQCSDIFNQHYNPLGKQQASEYRFPFADASFNFVLLTSVFTHLLPAALRNYVSEVARVLKPGGRCFITCYLLNLQALQMIEAGMSYETFRFVFDGCRIETAENPEHIVAYDEITILGLYEKSGLTLRAPVYHGAWCGRKNCLTHQDVIVAQKEQAAEISMQPITG